jgi:hypothetical protein
MKTILICVMSIIGLTATVDIKGRWETRPSEKGNVTGVVFKADSTYEGYVNKKPFVSGIYSFSPDDSVISITDGGCGGVTGVYKVGFLSNGDSMRFTAINDSCSERREGMQRLVMGRVRK